jgi:glycosyltransferase involved in cell wall biosynthesis
MGRLHPTKGVYELAHAVTMLPSDMAFELEIRGVVHAEVERQVQADIKRILAGDPRVTIAPAVPPDEVLGALAAYDVLCCPSTWFENGPTVAIEAMAVGTPVIGTRLGNLAELITDGVDGCLVAPGDAADLAGAIARIARSPAIVDTWRANLGPARTMDEIAGDYERLYSELTASTPACVSAF